MSHAVQQFPEWELLFVLPGVGFAVAAPGRAHSGAMKTPEKITTIPPSTEQAVPAKGKPGAGARTAYWERIELDQIARRAKLV